MPPRASAAAAIKAAAPNKTAAKSTATKPINARRKQAAPQVEEEEEEEQVQEQELAADDDEEQEADEDEAAEDEEDDQDGEMTAEDLEMAAAEEAAEREAAAGHAHGDEEEEEDADVDGLSAPVQSKSPHALTLDAATSAAYTAAMDARGVVYISRIPPYMKAAKLRWLLQQMIPATKKHGRIGRIFLTPEDASFARKRKKAGGNTGKKFVDGWVEFESKKVARWIAETFNTQPMGGPKRSRYVEDLWTLKYLSGFKWNHLTEKIAYEKQIRGTKIREEMSQAKRDSEYYLNQVDRSKKLDTRKPGSKRKHEGDDEGGAAAPAAKSQRTFHQRTLIDAKKLPTKAATK